MMPFDKIPHKGIGGFVKAVITIFKNLRNIFKNKSAAVGESEPVNDKTSIDDIDKISELLSAYRTSVNEVKSVIEAKLAEEVDYYLEGLLMILDDEIVNKYNINIRWIKKDIDSITSNLKGLIDKEVSGRISFDSTDCMSILRMLPGAKKEKAMSEYSERVLHESLELCCENLKADLKEIYKDVEEEVNNAIKTIQNESSLNAEAFAEINADNYQEQAEKCLNDAHYLSDLSDLIIEII